jgi:hypothetical protein
MSSKGGMTNPGTLFGHFDASFLVLGLIPIGFVRFSIRMGWKWVGIDGKGYANTTYISEFHPHIPAVQKLQNYPSVTLTRTF